MKKENENSFQLNPPQYGYPVMYQQEDEIDLYGLFSSIFSQWKLIAAITLAGTVLAILYVLLVPKQYEAVVQVARPEAADIKALNIRGNKNYTSEEIFIKYYSQLRSAELFKTFLKETGWYKEQPADLSKEELFLSLFKGFKAEIIRPHKAKKNDIDPIPEVVTLKLAGNDEVEIVELANNYVKFVKVLLVNKIKEKGQYSVSMEIEGLEQAIKSLRVDAKVRRGLLISKIEEKNQEKITTLEREKKLLLIKASRDKESKIEQLKEAYGIAKSMGIKKLTTIDALATENKSAKTMVTLGGKDDNRLLALMGTIYLNSELEALQNRKNDALFIPEISEINMQIEGIKEDKYLVALKARKSDDPYIEKLPSLFKRLDQLKQLTFDFSGVQLYRLDKSAMVSGIAVKPNKKLIVAIAFILSGFVSLFVVLIVNLIRKNKESEEKLT